MGVGGLQRGVGLFAQSATLASSGATRPSWRKASRAQLVAFVGACVAFGPEMWVVVLNTVVGLVPVIVAEILALRLGAKCSAWVAGGLVLSMLTGVVQVGHLSMAIWFNHIDLAHALMGVSFWLIVRGSGRGGRGLQTVRRVMDPRAGDSVLPGVGVRR